MIRIMIIVVHFHNYFALNTMSEDFYCRYYVGHRGKFGHEFMEFEITEDGKLRYANNSNYKNDVMIRKEGCWEDNYIDVTSLIFTFVTLFSILWTVCYRGSQTNYSRE